MNAPPIPDLTCSTCRYLINNFCHWAQQENAPPWVSIARPIPDPTIGKDCDVWDTHDER